jgi:hypothetical protein
VTSDLDGAIDRLDDALRGAGFEGLAAASEDSSLDELDQAIAPYSLPLDLHRFWERVEFESLRVSSWSLPERCSPRTALDTHRLNLDPDLFPLQFGPPLLFPIARHSGDQWSIELVSRWCEGGIVFTHGDPGPVRIEYPSFSDLLEVYAELIEERRFTLHDNGYGSLDREEEQARRRARIAAAQPHPVYGCASEIGSNPARWPAHWLESAGIDPRSREPLGATHTIAQLVDASQRGPVQGRIGGEVVGLAGAGSDLLVLVAEHEQSVLVFCPRAATTWRPAMGRRFEFEVTVAEPVRDATDEAPLGRLFDGHTVGAVATAVRPLD